MKAPLSRLPLILEPVGSSVRGTVIFLHGLGDTGYGWEPVAKVWQQSVPGVRFVLPHARLRPVTINGGMSMPAWYDICGLTADASEDLDGYTETAAHLHDLIREEAARLGPDPKVALGGFSQGGVCSLYAGYSSKTPLCGVFALSSYLPARSGFFSRLSPHNATTPYFIAHGDLDPVISLAMAQASYQEILHAKAAPRGEFVIYPGLDHASCPQEISAVSDWLNRRMV